MATYMTSLLTRLINDITHRGYDAEIAYNIDPSDYGKIFMLSDGERDEYYNMMTPKIEKKARGRPKKYTPEEAKLKTKENKRKFYLKHRKPKNQAISTV